MAPSIRERLARHRSVAYALLLAAASCAVSAAIVLADRGGAAVPLLYLWISAVAYHLLERRIARAEIAVAGAGYALTGVTAWRWLVVIGSIWAAGELIGVLRERMQALRDQLAEATVRDPLTGLLGQHGFGERLEAALAQSNRSGREFSLVLADLDGFREVHDRDAVLARVVPLLETAARGGDAIGRLGGDEFALLLDGADHTEAYMVVERLRADVATTFAGDDVAVTASFGVAAWPDHGGSARGLLFAADCALYAAKGLGRDRTVIYSDQLRRRGGMAA